MTTITEAEFARIVSGLNDDRDSIIKHNPIGTDEEILLWMLLACLTSYLNLDDKEMPCFTGKPDATTYRKAIVFVLRTRKVSDFGLDVYLRKLR
ncbi:MAG: hypothetical protein KBD94_11790 [Pyrinomonadaceae bacterium]|nr:hypothetical protein [Pyrinomonadaceae bacterium]